MAKVTRDDVARLAGTSTAVVSYVINNGPRPVAPATKEKVLAAIEQLGYRPNSVAQAMASRRTNLIGMVVPDARQPFFAEMAHAVERAASDRGKLVLIGNSDYVDDREVHYVRAFLGMRVSGLILVSQGPSQRAAEEFAAMEGAKVVLLHRRPEAIDDVAVVTDDVGGAELAVRHLLEVHKAPYVACFGGPVESPAPGDPVIDHVEGWQRAMDAHGLPTAQHLIDAPFHRYGAYEVAVRLLRSAERPCGHLLLHRRPGDRRPAGRPRGRPARPRGPRGGRVRRRPRGRPRRPAADHRRLRPGRDGPGRRRTRAGRLADGARLRHRAGPQVPLPPGRSPLVRLRNAREGVTSWPDQPL